MVRSQALSLLRRHEALTRIGEAKPNNVSDEHDRDALLVLVVAGDEIASERSDDEGVALWTQLLECGHGPTWRKMVAGDRPVCP